MVGKPAPMLGELLISKRLITPQQLEEALAEQRTTGAFLGMILVQRGWLTEEALLAALAEKFEIPYGRLSQELVDWSVARRFPSALLTEHLCFPIRMDGQVVRVAIANPLDAVAVSELEQLVKPRKVQLVLVAEREIRAALQQAHQQALKSLGGPTP